MTTMWKSIQPKKKKNKEKFKLTFFGVLFANLRLWEWKKHPFICMIGEWTFTKPIQKYNYFCILAIYYDTIIEERGSFTPDQLPLRTLNQIAYIHVSWTRWMKINELAIGKYSGLTLKLFPKSFNHKTFSYILILIYICYKFFEVLMTKLT